MHQLNGTVTAGAFATLPGAQTALKVLRVDGLALFLAALVTALGGDTGHGQIVHQGHTLIGGEGAAGGLAGKTQTNSGIATAVEGVGHLSPGAVVVVGQYLSSGGINVLAAGTGYVALSAGIVSTKGVFHRGALRTAGSQRTIPERNGVGVVLLHRYVLIQDKALVTPRQDGRVVAAVGVAIVDVGLVVALIRLPAGGESANSAFFEVRVGNGTCRRYGNNARGQQGAQHGQYTQYSQYSAQFCLHKITSLY